MATQQPRQTKARTATTAAKAKTVATQAAVKEAEKVEVATTETTTENTSTVDNTPETPDVPDTEDKKVEDTEGLPETDPQAETDAGESADEEEKDEQPEAETKADVDVQDLGNGITLTKPAAEGVRNQTLEGFLESKYGLRPENYSEYLKRTIRGFEQYHANMNSRVPVSLEEAARHQASWYRTVAGALDSTAGDSMICFDAILHLAYRHCDDLFSDRLACRAYHLLPQNIRDVFTVYQTVIVNAANPRTRQRYIKNSLSLDALGAAINSDNQRSNLINYLSSQITD